MDGPDYVIGEAADKVCSTTAPAAESGKEQSSKVEPEIMSVAETSVLDGMTGGEVEREVAGAVRTEDAGGTSTELGTTETRVAGIENPGTGTGGTKAEGTTTAAGDGNGQASPGQADPAKPSGDTSPTEEATLPPTRGRDESAETVSAVSYGVYTVADGETLYDICFKLYHNPKHIDEICQVSAPTDENSIYVGQKSLVP